MGSTEAGRGLSQTTCARLQALAAEEAAATDAAAGEQLGAASRRKLSSALDPTLYSDRAVLELVGGTREGGRGNRLLAT